MKYRCFAVALCGMLVFSCSGRKSLEVEALDEKGASIGTFQGHVLSDGKVFNVTFNEPDRRKFISLLKARKGTSVTFDFGPYGLRKVTIEGINAEGSMEFSVEEDANGSKILNSDKETIEYFLKPFNS